jgi:hypothetical protein
MKTATETLVLLQTGWGQLENVANYIRDLEDRLLEFLPSSHVWRKRHNDKKATPLMLANKIRTLYRKNPELRVVLTGHSMGGRAVNDCAWRLKAFGVPVYAEVLCDAFGRGWGSEPIIAPSNVRIVEAFVSKENLIEGSEVCTEEDSGTVNIVHPPFNVSHIKMPKLSVYQDRVIAFAKGAA